MLLPLVDDNLVGMRRYNLLRPYLEDGDVLEWRSNTAIGFLIRSFTKKDVNHTGGILRLKAYEDSPGDRVVTPEALEDGFVLSALSKRLEKFDGEVYLLKLKPEYDPLRRFVAAQQLKLVGIPYDFSGVLGNMFGAVSIDAKKFFCSEAIGYSLEQACVIQKQDKALRPGQFEQLGVFLPRVRIF